MPSLEFKLDGKLITSIDPTLISINFRQLVNLRYFKDYLRGVGGMSKINTTALSNPHIQSSYHYKKSFPQESHIIVQATDLNDNNPKLYQNIKAIPSTGDFESTVLYTENTNSGICRFSNSPKGDLIICDGKETLIWGGDELECSGMINFDPNDLSVWYDFSSIITNTKVDSDNVATLKRYADTIDANTMLLLHMDGTDGSTVFTDSSPTTPHTVTANGNAQIDTADSKFGDACGLFDGNGDWLSIPDNADFDFSGGVFTIDFWIKIVSGAGTVYHQQTDANNKFTIEVNFDTGSNPIGLLVNIRSAGSLVLFLSNSNGDLTQWTHFAIVENSDNWYLFMNGQLVDSKIDTDRAANYTGSVFIGGDGITATTSINGWIDEFRISNNARWQSNFTVPTRAYGFAGFLTSWYVAALRPLSSVKNYVATANTQAGTQRGYYWSGNGWTEVSNALDGTASGGVPLAQTGIFSFDSTVGLAKVKSINGIVLYWYRFDVDNADDNISLSRITLESPVQELVDIWDGSLRSIIDFQIYKSKYEDYSINVFEQDYISGAAGEQTKVDLNGLTSSFQYCIVGFSDQMSGIDFRLIENKVNTNVATMIISYWDGSDWSAIGMIDDGTMIDGKSLSKSGLVTWNPISITKEFKTTVGEGIPLYYYKVEWSADLSGTNIFVDKISGIPAQKIIDPYKFSISAQNRLFLCSNQINKKNTVLVSSLNTSQVFNGDDSKEIHIGDENELVAGEYLFTQVGSSFYSLIIFCKKDETWVLSGNSISDWVLYKVFGNIGCVAPKTLIKIELNPNQTIKNKASLLIWQSANDIGIFDGKNWIPITEDISNIFNKDDSNSFNYSIVDEFVGFFDADKQEYHWLYASKNSTTLDKEFVFSFNKWAWFEIDRGSGQKLQDGLLVSDTEGNKFSYGFIDTGFMLRLENSNSFLGSNINQSFWFGDIPLHEGRVDYETIIRGLKLISVSKVNTTNKISITHYLDTDSVGTSLSNFLVNTFNKRITDTLQTEALGSGIFHSLLASLSTNNEQYGFEPIFMVIRYKIMSQDRG